MAKFKFLLVFSILAIGLIGRGPEALADRLKFEVYTKKPKLILVLVIDQFRADYLTRFQARFMRSSSKGEVGGFNYLMSQGAYFPLAEYDILQSMTCPGHATILTGSHPIMNGIPLNDFFDRREGKMVYCVDDAEYGVSPRRLTTTTVGDELKNSGSASKVIGIALKDRSGVMLGGQRADFAFWMNSKTFSWETSPYYAKEVPKWVGDLNRKLLSSGRMALKDPSKLKAQMSSNLGTELTQEMALAALNEEKLGKRGVTDILAVSFSSHDYLGHQVGPNHQAMEELTIFEDAQISKVLTGVKKSLGSLKEVVVVLTADHGIPPTNEFSKGARIDSGRIDDAEVYKSVYAHLNQKFGTPKAEWFRAGKSLNYYLSPEALAERKVSSIQAEAEIKKVLTNFPGVFEVITRSEVEARKFPLGFLGEQVQHSYHSQLSGDIILIPKPFYWIKDGTATNHMTGYSYDRTVPLVLVGKGIRPGVYGQTARVVDLAPTLSYILGILPPATSVGRVLHEVFY